MLQYIGFKLFLVDRSGIKISYIGVKMVGLVLQRIEAKLMRVYISYFLV